IPAPAGANPTGTRFVNANSGKCLGVQDGNMTPGTAVVQFTCNGHPDQVWNSDYTTFANEYPAGYALLRNAQDSSKCLGVWQGGAFDGAQLVIWNCNDHPDQEWSFQTDILTVSGVGGPVLADWHFASGRAACQAFVNFGASSPPGQFGLNLNTGAFPRVAGVL